MCAFCFALGGAGSFFFTHRMHTSPPSNTTFGHTSAAVVLMLSPTAIKACFDEISHDWLLQHIPMDKQMLAKWLNAGYWEENQLFPTSKGTPQGGLISPILANLTLDGMEQAIQQALGRKRGDKVNF